MGIRKRSIGSTSASRPTWFAALAACIAVGGLGGCSGRATERIAVIPQTEGTLVWEAAHVGAEEAVRNRAAFIYWNAPAREDDVEAQIGIVDRVVGENYQGLVLAPDQSLALITPVRRALARGMPAVVIGSPLAMPAGNNLFYILNDNQAGGRIAAQRVGEILHGSGSVAILGINPDLAGVMTRARVFESVLAQQYPRIRIVEKRLGSFNVPHEQQVAQDTIEMHPDLDAIVAMSGPSVDGALATLSSLPPGHAIHMIGFDVDTWPILSNNPSLDCVIQEDTRTMGRLAVELILDKRAGKPAQAETLIPPTVITRGNVDSPQVRAMWSQDWTLGRIQWSSLP
jgi:ribose transport system substrate-binding protein